jgi:hypothetical protein
MNFSVTNYKIKILDYSTGKYTYDAYRHGQPMKRFSIFLKGKINFNMGYVGIQEILNNRLSSNIRALIKSKETELLEWKYLSFDDVYMDDVNNIWCTSNKALLYVRHDLQVLREMATTKINLLGDDFIDIYGENYSYAYLKDKSPKHHERIFGEEDSEENKVINKK